MPEPAAAPIPRRSVLAEVAKPGRYGAANAEGPGITLSHLHPISLATVIAHAGQEAALSDALRDRWGVALPGSGEAALGGALAFLWAGPGQWYARAEGLGEGALVKELHQALGAHAAISDQSHGRVVLRIGGARARDLLAKGTPVDLHPRAFGPGQTALTQMAHVGVHLTQIDEAPTFEISLFRGFAESFWEWLCHSAAEYGYEVV
jgi:sarcosine oxidase subunit gamma